MRKIRRKNRRGAAVLEMAIILGIFLVTTMGMLDLGVGVYRYHLIAQAARFGARRAIVHGEMASQLGSWGPATIDVAATASEEPIVDGAEDGIQPMLIGCDLSQSRIRVEWLDGSNGFEDRVRVTVTSPYTPLFLFILSNTTINLTASSTMRIAH